MRPLVLATLALTWAAVAPAAVTLPPGFSHAQVADGLTGTTAMAIAPDGRLFLCEQTGALRVVKGDVLVTEPFVTLKVDSRWERGLLGVALDPNFATNSYVYVCYVAPDPFPHHRISRFTAVGDVAVAGSEVILFEGDDQDTQGGSVQAGHQGGALHFGGDGKLYIAIGEQTAGTPAQRMDTLLGKMLRINPDGTIPADNPFSRTAKDKYRAIWALGLRNPFTFAVQPGTGRILINDVGGNFEEVNEGHAGANYGWPTVEHGPTSDRRFRGPVHWYPVSSITGGDFCPTMPVAGGFPAEYRGKYFFMDFLKGWIKVLDPEAPSRPADFATGLARPVDLKFAPDGSLYYLSRDAWVIDKDFRPKTGALFKIRARPPDSSRPASRPTPVAAVPSTPPPPIAPAGGSYTGPITVRLTLGHAGASVRYTTDGSAPTPTSAVYRSPFPLDASATVTARAFQGESPVGPVVAATYRIQGTTPYGLTDRPPLEALNVPMTPADLPRRLSQTGVFAALADLTPRPGIIPYTVNSPLWSDGAEKRRWIALPGGEPIGFAATGEWSFPRGTVFIKHFELPVDETSPGVTRRLETRLLVVDGPGSGFGVTYKWRADGGDADLLTDAATEDIPIKTARGTRTQTWSFPGRDDCVKCHSANAGFVLGPKARQLNGAYRYPMTGIADNQLRTWSYLGMLRPAPDEAAIARLPRLVAIDDATSPLEHRVRSYLDANCANCHRPGTSIPAAFDARFDTPLARQGMLDAPTVSDSLGIDRPQIVAPGDPARSLLYQRLIQTERFKMPPLARNRVDEPAAAVLEAWIKGLSRGSEKASRK